MATATFPTADPGTASKAKGKRRGTMFTVFLGALAVHLIFGGVAAVWVVATYMAPKPPTFEVHKETVIPAKEREHRMDMAEASALAPAPKMSSKVVALTPTALMLPDLPSVPLDEMLPLNAADIVSDSVGGIGDGDGTGGDGTGRGGKKPELDLMNFFGIKDSGRSVVIMIDVSDSMFGRTGDYDYTTRRKLREGKDQSFQAVRDQAISLVEKLSISTRFGIVRWSGGAYSWMPELVPATEENKRAAIDHIQNEVDVKTAGPTGGRPGGTRHDYALEEVFKLKPEVVFMLSDGNATSAGDAVPDEFGGGDTKTQERPERNRDRNNRGGGGFQSNLVDIPVEKLIGVIEEGQTTLEEPARIHVIYYVTGQDKNNERSLLRKIASKTGGSFKVVRADKK